MDYPSLTDGYAAPGNGWWPYAKYPELHRGRVAGYCPSLGNTADRLWDFSGNGNHGTMLPTFATGPAWDVSEGRYASNFTGTNYVDCGTSELLNITGDITLSVWVETTAVSKYVISKLAGCANALNVYSLHLNESGKAVFTTSGNANILAGAVMVNDGAWYFLVARINGTAMSLFIDGVADGTATVTTARYSNAAAVTEIGAVSVCGSGSNLSGLIDDAQIYNRALSQNEITQLYQLGRGGSYAIDYEMMMEEMIAAGGPFPHFIRRSQQLSGGLVAC